MFSSIAIWHKDRTPAGATIPSQSEPGMIFKKISPIDVT